MGRSDVWNAFIWFEIYFGWKLSNCRCISVLFFLHHHLTFCSRCFSPQCLWHCCPHLFKWTSFLIPGHYRITSQIKPDHSTTSNKSEGKSALLVSSTVWPKRAAGGRSNVVRKKMLLFLNLYKDMIRSLKVCVALRQSIKTSASSDLSAQGIIPRRPACSSCWNHPCLSSLSCSFSSCSSIFWWCRSSRWGWAAQPPPRWQSEPMEALSVTGEQRQCQWHVPCSNNMVVLLTWDFVDFVEEFALDFLKHVVFVDLCVVGAGHVHGCGGDGRRGGGHGHSGGAGGFSSRHRLTSEQVKLHCCKRLGGASLKHRERETTGEKTINLMWTHHKLHVAWLRVLEWNFNEMIRNWLQFKDLCLTKAQVMSDNSKNFYIVKKKYYNNIIYNIINTAGQTYSIQLRSTVYEEYIFHADVSLTRTYNSKLILLHIFLIYYYLYWRYWTEWQSLALHNAQETFMFVSQNFYHN